MNPYAIGAGVGAGIGFVQGLSNAMLVKKENIDPYVNVPGSAISNMFTGAVTGTAIVASAKAIHKGINTKTMPKLYGAEIGGAIGMVQGFQSQVSLGGNYHNGKFDGRRTTKSDRESATDPLLIASNMARSGAQGALYGFALTNF